MKRRIIHFLIGKQMEQDIWLSELEEQEMHMKYINRINFSQKSVKS